jgi:hypothetical protein
MKAKDIEHGIPPYSPPTRRAGRIRGLGPESAGQSGDTQGLSDTPAAGNQSVEELAEEGQSFEAQIIAGVEDAETREGRVKPLEPVADDVPGEYQEKDSEGHPDSV